MANYVMGTHAGLAFLHHVMGLTLLCLWRLSEQVHGVFMIRWSVAVGLVGWSASATALWLAATTSSK